MSKLEIGYWSIRGLCAPLRMMCSFKGVEHEDKQYEKTLHEDGSTTGDEWFNVRKPELLKKNPMVNLPYVADGDFVVTQSNACLLYLGRKFDLNGSTELEIQRNDQVMCEAFDLRNLTVRACYPSDINTAAEFPSTMKRHWGMATNSLNKLESWLATTDTKFASADRPLSGDFALWEMLDQHTKMKNVNDEECLLKSRPHVKKYYEAFRELPELKSYFASPAYALPMNNCHAHFK